MHSTTPRARRGQQSAGPTPSASNVSHGLVAALFYVLSLLSGAAALVYQVTWAKLLSLTFGSSTLAGAAVVAGFMGGMAVGAWLYHFLQRRFPLPAPLYAGIEIGIAVSSAVLTRLFYLMPAWFAELAAHLPAGPAVVVVRFGLIVLLVFIPTALMGATFPALCTIIITTARGLDRHLGLIYGFNTIGAAVGVLLGGLWLIPHFGLSRTVMAGNALNLVVGLAALAIAWRVPRLRRSAEPVPPAEAVIPTALPRAITGVVLFGSGFVTLGYEILWFRALRYTVGNSTYAFTAVVFVFLLGLGLGATLLRVVTRRGRVERDLALCQAAIAVLAILAMGLHTILLQSGFFRDQVSVFSARVMEQSWAWRWSVHAGITLVTLLPATIAMGLSFPLATRLFAGDVNKLGASLGVAYLWASLGSIAGTIGAAVVLLPFFGTVGGTKLLAGFNVALSAVVFVALVGMRGLGRPLFLTAVVWCVVGVIVLPAALPFRGEGLGAGAEPRLVFQEEADLATVQVLEDAQTPTIRKMLIDGYGIGWDRGFQNRTLYRKQVFLAHLPMVLDTRLKHTLNVGLGSGITVQAVTGYPHVQSIDCVEISPAVVRAAERFSAAAAFSDPRTRIIVEDAIHFLLTPGKAYDVIISDGKQNPAFSGNATLLCREFYDLARRRLSEHGLFVQWLTINMLEEDIRINLRTLAEVFPYVELFYEPRESLFAVASTQPLFGRPMMSLEAFRSLAVSRDIESYGMDSPTAVLGRWVAGRPQFMKLLETEPISTWDRLYLDFSSFAARGSDWRAAEGGNLRLLLAAEAVSREETGTPIDIRGSAMAQSSSLIRRAFGELVAGRAEAAHELAKQAMSVNPDDHAAPLVERILALQAGKTPVRSP